MSETMVDLVYKFSVVLTLFLFMFSSVPTPVDSVVPHEAVGALVLLLVVPILVIGGAILLKLFKK